MRKQNVTESGRDLGVRLKCGNIVQWESQANGVLTTKKGRVIEVVPSGDIPHIRLRNPGGPRDHESYVVQTGLGGRIERLYWPRVSHLTLLALLLALLLAPGARADEVGPIIYVAGAALDLVSTEQALAHGAVEANPIMRGSTGKRMAIKAGLTAGVIFLDRKIKSKPVRWIVRAGWILAHGYVAKNNWDAARNGR